MNTSKSFTDEQLENVAQLTGIASALLTDAREDGGNAPETAEQLLSGLDTIAEWYKNGDATDTRANQAVDLMQKLFYDYRHFPSEFLEVAVNDNPQSKAIEQLLRNGTVTAKTTFGELAELLATLSVNKDV